MVVKYPVVALAAAVALVVLAPTTEAQWLELPTPGIPRLPDGTPNLTAPTPRTPDGKPDFSGIWRTPTGRYLRNLAADGIEVPMQRGPRSFTRSDWPTTAETAPAQAVFRTASRISTRTLLPER